MTDQTESKDNPIQCHNCGYDNLPTAAICVVCDSPLTNTSRFQKVQQKPQQKPAGLLPPIKDELHQARLEEEQKLIEIAKKTFKTNLEEQEEQAKSAEIKMTTSSQQEGAKCVDCGYVNLIGDLFCLDCGASLTLIPEKESPANITQKMKAMSLSEIQAVVEKQKASAPVPVFLKPPQLNVAKPEQKSSDGDIIHDGCFQFTSDMHLRFTEIETGHYTEITPNKDKPLLVGRSHESLPSQPEVDLTPFLVEQHGVSRRHAVIRLRDLRLEIQDLNSTNGTGINGFQFQPKATHQIRNGDIVTLGRISMKVSFLREDVFDKDNVTEKLHN